MKPYEEFRAAVRERESSGNYACRNELGYLGGYQFGTARLCDLGLCRRIPGTEGFANACFEFIAPHSETTFLSDPKLQDECFDRHVQMLKHQVLAHSPHYPNLSGAIGGCHLLGFGGFLDFLKGVDGADAFGTRFSDYHRLFSGYDIP